MNLQKDNILRVPLAQIVADLPIATDFFLSYNIDPRQINQSFLETIDNQPAQFWEDHSINADEFTSMFIDFLNGLEDAGQEQKINTLEVLSGNDKHGNPEPCNLLMKPGEITCIVGPTGSGKSRLLADIEWLADMDTPTKRRVLINGEPPDDNLKNSFGGKLIAQITQNMNFVLDMEVQSFLLLHAQSRFLDDAESKVAEVIRLANELSGESFEATTPVTFLSGGQSRALMIADVALIGQAPIVLIDEIENAGVDKKKALELLISQEKIVLMATHDPMLILQADKRVVIKNGGMQKIITTSEQEKELYLELQKIDDTMQNARNFFRMGHTLDRINAINPDISNMFSTHEKINANQE